MRSYFFRNLQLPLLGNVYEPSEDSYLLAKHIKIGQATSSIKAPTVGLAPSTSAIELPASRITALDMGCGSGIQSVQLLLQDAQVTAADIDEIALQNTQMCAVAINKQDQLTLVKSNLFDSIPESKKFDCIVFNPPYVASHSLTHLAVDGGLRGRQVLDRFLEKVAGHLTPNGVCYFLQSSLNGTQETLEKLQQHQLQGKMVGSEKIWFEELQVWQCVMH